MNSAGITNRIYDFAVALAGWMRGGLAHVNIIGSVIFAGMSGTAIADAAGLGTIEIKAMKDHGYDDRILRRRHGRVLDARADHPAVAAVRDLRHDGECLDRRAVSRRRRSRRRDDAVHDALCLLLRAPLQYGPRPGFPLEGTGADLRGGVSGAAHAGDHHRRHDVRLVHADRGGDRGLRLGDDPRHLPLSLDVAEAVLQGHDGHDRDHRGRAADRRRGLAVRLGADDHARDRIRDRGAARGDRQPLRHPAAGERRAAGRRLLPRADCVDQYPGAGADAGDRSRSASIRCISAW